MLTLQIHNNGTEFCAIVRENDLLIDVQDFSDGLAAQDWGLERLEALAGERSNRIAELSLRFRDIH
jgi:hypothetical protein